MASQDRLLYTLAHYAPWLLRLLLSYIAGNARKDPKSVLSLFSELCEADRALLAAPGGLQWLSEMVLGAFQQGTRGVAWDWKLEALPWGFALAEIKIPVDVWHGESDTLVPLANGKYLAQAIPNCQAHYVPGEGHMSLLSNCFREIVGALVGR